MPKQDTSDEWLTPKQAAAYLKLHPKTLYRYVRAGKLQQHRLAGQGRPRFRRSDLDELMVASNELSS